MSNDQEPDNGDEPNGPEDPSKSATEETTHSSKNPDPAQDLLDVLLEHDGADLPDAHTPPGRPATLKPVHPGGRKGQVIGRYKLLEVIGEGGMGEVWMAQQEEPVRRRVALKIIKLGMDTQDVVARFEAERQALALMDHPHIARVYDGGATNSGRPYFVMELVQGLTITAFCKESRLPTRKRLALFTQVCQAVQHAHQKGIIHRDIKPSNVLVSLNDGVPFPKVIDFGIAKATQQKLTERTFFTHFGQMIGTPAYMAPEQAETSLLGVDTRSDIYSLGVLLYELLTETTPFEENRLRSVAYDELCRIIREEEPPKPSTRLSTLGDKLTTVASRQQTETGRLGRAVKGELDWIVMKALEKDRTRRYDGVAAFTDDINRYLNDEPVTAAAPSVAYRFRKAVRRHRTLAIAGAVVLASVLVGAALTTWQAIRATIAEREVKQQYEVERALRSEQETLTAREREQHELADQRLRNTWLRNAFQADEEGDSLRSLLWLARLVEETEPGSKDRWAAFSQSRRSARLVEETEPGSEDDRLARLRFAAYLRAQPRLLDVFTHGEPAPRLDNGWFSPDGSRVVTAGQILGPRRDGRVAVIWDTYTGKRLGTTAPHPGTITQASFSHDGSLLATACTAREVYVWNGLNAESVSPVFPHPREVFWVEFSPDDEYIATACHDGTITVWDHDADDEDREVFSTQLPNEVWRVRFIGKKESGELWVVATCNDGVARVYNLEGNLVCRLPHEGENMQYLEVSHDHRLVATSGGEGVAKVWDVSSRETAGTLLNAFAHHAGIWVARFSASDRLLLTTCRDGNVWVWDLETGGTYRSPLPQGAPPDYAAFSPDDRYVMAMVEGRGNVWNLSSGKRAMSQLKHHATSHYGHFDPRGERLLTVSLDGSAKLWSAMPAMPARFPSEHKRRIRHIALDSSGARLASGSDDQTAIVWDLTDGEAPRMLMRLGHDGEVVHTEFSPDGQRLLTASYDGHARVWDVANGEMLVAMRHGEDVMHACFDPSGEKVATASSDTSARVWNATTGEPLTGPLLHDHSRVLHVCFSPDGKLVSSSGMDSTNRVWDVETGEPAAENPSVYGPDADVAHAVFSHDGARLYSASANGGCWTVDWKTGSPASLEEEGTGRTRSLVVGHAQRVVHVALSPDGGRLVTSSYDKTARVWDATTAQALTPPLKHDHHVTWSAWSPDGKLVVTASRDRTARVWDAATGNPVTPPLKHPDWVSMANFAAEGKTLITASGANIYRWRLDDAGIEDGDHSKIAVLLNAAVPDGNDMESPIQVEAVHRLHQELKIRYPDLFSLPPDDLASFHRHEARRAQNEVNWAAAALHWDWANEPERAAHARSRAALRETRTQPEGWHTAIPPRDAEATSRMIDLSDHYNVALTMARKGASSPRSHFGALPSGLRVYGGVPFDVRGIVRTMHQTDEKAPYPPEVTGIAVGRKCDKIHFLHEGSAGQESRGYNVGMYRLHYEDGEVHDIELVSGMQLRSAFFVLPGSIGIYEAALALQVWNADHDPSDNLSGSVRRLFKYTVENPRPDAVIESLDVIAHQGLPSYISLFAVTLE